MEFYKNNAYQEIFLHDCRFKLDYENKNLRLLFDEGFAKWNGSCIEKKRGYIQISDLPLIEVDIRGVIGELQGDKYKETIIPIEFSELCQLLRDFSLEVIDEFYARGKLLYKCCVVPYHEKQIFDSVELTIDFDDRALEYYIEK